MKMMKLFLLALCGALSLSVSVPVVAADSKKPYEAMSQAELQQELLDLSRLGILDTLFCDENPEGVVAKCTNFLSKRILLVSTGARMLLLLYPGVLKSLGVYANVAQISIPLSAVALRYWCVRRMSEREAKRAQIRKVYADRFVS